MLESEPLPSASDLEKYQSLAHEYRLELRRQQEVRRSHDRDRVQDTEWHSRTSVQFTILSSLSSAIGSGIIMITKAWGLKDRG